MTEPSPSVLAIALLALLVIVVHRAQRPYRQSRRFRRETEILFALAQHPEGMYGLRLCEEIGVGPGTLYPALARLEQNGQIYAWWGEHVYEGGPRRRYYGIAPEAWRATEDQ